MRLLKDTGGAAAVEFTLIFPVLAMLALGITQYGVYFGVSHAVQQLANDSARVAVAGLSEAERRAIVANHVNAKWRDYGLHRQESVNVVLSQGAGEIVVRARYDAAYLPIFALEGLVPMPPAVIDNSATVRLGGY